MALIVREACTHNFVQTNGNAIILGTFGQATPHTPTPPLQEKVKENHQNWRVQASLREGFTKKDYEKVC